MEQFKMAIFNALRWLVKLIYPKLQVRGLENLPEEPCLIISNHAQMHGPIAAELYMPRKHYIWCVGEMMHLKEVPDYAFRDFWSRKPKYLQPFFRLMSYLIAPLAVFIFNTGPGIEVRHDRRVLATIQNTAEKLQEGADVVIFPEHDVPHNHIVCDFQEGFVSAARTYHRHAGKPLAFVPMYLAPSIRTVCLGKPIWFDPEAPIKEERRRICDALMDSITEMALVLPRHRVTPYNNISRKEYPYSIPKEGDHEKAGG